MNNLKFRVWSKKDNTLYYPEKFSGVFVININGDILGFDAETKSFEYLNEKDYVMQQFTGLKDKNGKEIYCGDIIKLGGETIIFNNQRIFEVKFGDGRFYLSGYRYITDVSGSCKIIGNIFENPELITA